MKSIFRPVFALLASLTFSFAAVPDDVRGNLDKLIPEVIRLLEAKDFAAVLETLVPPDDFKQMTAAQPLAEFAKEFGEHNASELLKALKAIKGMKPKVSDDGGKTTYELPEGGEFPHKTMEFLRVEGRWFLK
jgi:hypothetical protein